MPSPYADQHRSHRSDAPPSRTASLPRHGEHPESSRSRHSTPCGASRYRSHRRPGDLSRPQPSRETGPSICRPSGCRGATDRLHPSPVPRSPTSRGWCRLALRQPRQQPHPHEMQARTHLLSVSICHCALPPPLRMGRRPAIAGEHSWSTDELDPFPFIFDRHEGRTVLAAGMPVVGGLVRPLPDPSRGSVSVPFVCHTLWRILAVSATPGVRVPSPDYFSWDDARVTEGALLLRSVQRAPVCRGAGGRIRRRIASTSTRVLSEYSMPGISACHGTVVTHEAWRRTGPTIPMRLVPRHQARSAAERPLRVLLRGSEPVSLPTPRQQHRGDSGPILRHCLPPSYDDSRWNLYPSSSPVSSACK